MREHVFGHTYGEGVIRLFMQLVLDAACSLRGGSAVLKLLCGLIPGLERAPACNTGTMWLLRIGLYELTRDKESANDWTWIIDHTIQIGTVKCLLIVAVRLSQWQAADRPLTHQDLQVFALEPVEKSDGSIVYQQLEQVQERTGIVPRAILSDEGTDLKNGIARFCEAHPQTTASLDIAHQAAKLLKHELQGDERWQRFLSQAGRSKQQLAQTTLAHLLPPTPRDKARYMNLGELVTWGHKVLAYLDDPHPVGGETVDLDKLHAKMSWLREFREALVEWGQVMDTISTTLDYVRHKGYHQGAEQAVRDRVAPFATTPMSRRLGEKLTQFVADQSQAAHEDEHLLGSSECIESLIGKGKRLEGQQSKSGFTRLVLGIAAAVVNPTKEFVTRALTSVKTEDVMAWCQQHLGISVQAKRRQALLNPKKNANQQRTHSSTAATDPAKSPVNTQSILGTEMG